MEREGAETEAGREAGIEGGFASDDGRDLVVPPVAVGAIGLTSNMLPPEVVSCLSGAGLLPQNDHLLLFPSSLPSDRPSPWFSGSPNLDRVDHDASPLEVSDKLNGSTRLGRRTERAAAESREEEGSGLGRCRE